MKTFTKVMLILASAFGTIGVICIVAAFAMGLTTSHLWNMVENGQFSFDLSDIPLGSTEEQVVEQGMEQKISEDCDSLEIEFGAGVLEIYYDDVEEIQVKGTNTPNITAEVKKGTLVIGMKSGITVTINNNLERKLTVILPRNMKFKQVEIEVGASQANITDLQTEELSIAVGAGQAELLGIDVSRLEVEVGAGQVKASLLGLENSYNYHVECGMGQVNIGSESYAGIAAQNTVNYPDATKEIEIECGMGQVDISFLE